MFPAPEPKQETATRQAAARALTYELGVAAAMSAGPKRLVAAPLPEPSGSGAGGPANDAAPGGTSHRSVLLANRHEPMLHGMAQVLRARGLTVCATCISAPEAVEAASVERPGICVIDVDLPGGGLAAATAISLQPDAPRIVMVAPAPADPEFFAALRAGAVGYLLEDIGAEELADALEVVAAGHAALAQPFVTRLVEEFRVRRRRAGGELTERERQVFLLLGEHLSTKEIAFRIGVDPTTVRRHLSAALRKLGVPDRRAALDLLDRVQQRGERQ